VNGQQINSHIRAKAILLNTLISLPNNFRKKTIKLQDGHWYYLKIKPQTDMSYDIFKRYCEKLNIKLEIK